MSSVVLSAVQKTLVSRKLTKQAQTKLKNIQNKIYTFATHKGILQEITLPIITKITQDVTNSSDQTKKAMQILENIKGNQTMANTIQELIGSPLPPTAPFAAIAGPSSSSQQDSVEDFMSEPSQRSSRRSSKRIEISSDIEEDIKKQLAARTSAQVTTPRTSNQSDDNNFMDTEIGNEDTGIAVMDRYMKI